MLMRYFLLFLIVSTLSISANETNKFLSRIVLEKSRYHNVWELSCKKEDCSGYRCEAKLILLAESHSNVAQQTIDDIVIKSSGLLFVLCRPKFRHSLLLLNRYTVNDFRVVNITGGADQFTISETRPVSSNLFDWRNDASLRLIKRDDGQPQFNVKCSYKFPVHDVQNISLYWVKNNDNTSIQLEWQNFKAIFTSDRTQIRVDYEHKFAYDREIPGASFVCEIFSQYRNTDRKMSNTTGQIPFLETLKESNLTKYEKFTLSEWSTWSKCKDVCVKGIRKRSRSCTSEINVATSHCLFKKTLDVELCPVKKEECQLTYWSLWSDWRSCRATCADSLMIRTRQCKDFKHTALRSGCVGEAVQYKRFSASCEGGSRSANRVFNEAPNSDCSSIKITCPNAPSGIYTVRACNDCQESFSIYCDMDSRNIGWTVIQRRVSSNVSFAKSWQDYKVGFGELDKDFWLGNERIRSFTKKSYVRSTSKPIILRVDLWYLNGMHRFAEYDRFHVGPENSFYLLQIGKYFGNAGDAFSNLNNTRFSTIDFNNETRGHDYCANSISKLNRTEGFWMSGCSWSNLNGEYNVSEKKFNFNEIFWTSDDSTDRRVLKKVEIKIAAESD